MAARRPRPGRLATAGAAAALLGIRGALGWIAHGRTAPTSPATPLPGLSATTRRPPCARWTCRAGSNVASPCVENRFVWLVGIAVAYANADYRLGADRAPVTVVRVLGRTHPLRATGRSPDTAQRLIDRVIARASSARIPLHELVVYGGAPGAVRVVVPIGWSDVLRGATTPIVATLIPEGDSSPVPWRVEHEAPDGSVVYARDAGPLGADETPGRADDTVTCPGRNPDAQQRCSVRAATAERATAHVRGTLFGTPVDRSFAACSPAPSRWAALLGHVE